MGLRQHEIDFANEIAKTVANYIKRDGTSSNGAIALPGRVTSAGEVVIGAGFDLPQAVDLDLPPVEPLQECPGDGCPGCAGCGRFPPLEPLPPSKFVATLDVRGVPEVVETLEQASALLEENATALELANAALELVERELEKTRVERDELRTQAMAAGAAAEDAFKMLFALTPHSDGQRAMYPLRGEHLQKLRLAQVRAAELHATARAIKS